ncbi:MAG: thiamine-phosphate kinase, partial [Bacteroidales bacterium]|nr:thiamine-phosphate kinase [Bacteroidales bacterium]
MKKGEFELIEWIKGQFEVPEGILSIGDDCAVLPQATGMETLVTTDMLVEGVHFLLEDIDPYSLGWKSAAVNISDIAGMGGRPVGTFLSTALPKDLDDEFLKGFIRGYKDMSDRFGCPLLGGDTTASKDKLCISVTVLGECEAGRSRKRSAAQPGDLICVTGPLGDSAAGLKVVLEKVESAPAPWMTKEKLGKKEEKPEPAKGEMGIAKEESEMTEGEREITKDEKSAEEVLRERHYRPVPRVTEGQ